MPEARWDEIAQDLRKDIESGKLKPGDTVPSENEIAARWRVCRMTAHRAMKELQREGLIIRSRGCRTVVADVQAKKTGVVALIFPKRTNALQLQYLAGVRQGLSENYQMLFFCIEDNPVREAQHLKQAQKEADGIILFSTCDPSITPIVRSIVEMGKPLVCIDRVPAGLDVDAVVSANYESSLDALRYMIAKGHSRIAYFAERNPNVSSARERYEAYGAAMAATGRDDVERWVRFFPFAPDWDFLVRSTQDALFTMLREPDPPTAIFCVHDFFLAAVLEACDKLGIRVPEEMEAVSVWDYPAWTLRNANSVNRIVQQTQEIGETAAGILERRMQRDDSPRQVIRIPAVFFPSEPVRNGGASTGETIGTKSGG